MGWNASLIIINNTNNFRDEASLLNAIGLPDLTYTEDTTLDECLYIPDEASIAVGYYKDCILICDNYIIIDDFLSKKIRPAAKGLARLFPQSEILAAACMSPVNFHGYSLIRNGEKIRLKAVDHERGVFLDEGEPLREELLIYQQSEQIDDQRIWRYDSLPGDLFREDQLLEDFTFGVAKRLLGVRIDEDEGEELMDSVVFRKFMQQPETSEFTWNRKELEGSWNGYFEYGPDYGEDLWGERVPFLLQITSYHEGVFEGRSVDVEGTDGKGRGASVNGFVEGRMICLTKQYPHHYYFDEEGNPAEDVSRPHPIVRYEGSYHDASKTFSGVWELPAREGSAERVNSGKWKMWKEENGNGNRS